MGNGGSGGAGVDGFSDSLIPYSPFPKAAYAAFLAPISSAFLIASSMPPTM